MCLCVPTQTKIQIKTLPSGFNLVQSREHWGEIETERDLGKLGHKSRILIGPVPTLLPSHWSIAS